MDKDAKGYALHGGAIMVDPSTTPPTELWISAMHDYKAVDRAIARGMVLVEDRRGTKPTKKSL